MSIINPSRWTLISIVILFISFGCEDQKKNAEKSYLPQARGEANAILVVMDSVAWSGKVGDALRQVFSEYVPGLPQSEPYLKIRNINPLKLNNILKSSKNMMFVSTLDNTSRENRKIQEFYSDEILKKIDADSSLFMTPQKNKWANGQEIMHLFGQTQDQMVDKLIANKSMLRNYFLKIENERLEKTLFKVREKGIEKTLTDEHGFMFKIPYGYDLAKDLKDFVWVRQLDPEVEKNIFVYFKPFDSKEPFDDVLAFRESITSVYMRDIEKPQIYMSLQGENGMYQVVKEINFNGKYAKEVRGLWGLEGDFSGGPFVSYTFVDESQKRIYYLEGYVWAPSKESKRIFMQELETIVNSFKSGEDLTK